MITCLSEDKEKLKTSPAAGESMKQWSHSDNLAVVQNIKDGVTNRLIALVHLHCCKGISDAG